MFLCMVGKNRRGPIGGCGSESKIYQSEEEKKKRKLFVEDP